MKDKDFKPYHGIVNDKEFVFANSIVQLKRLASRLANEDFKEIDNLKVYYIGNSVAKTISYVRINKIPKHKSKLSFEEFKSLLQNKSIRGEWKQI